MKPSLLTLGIASLVAASLAAAQNAAPTSTTSVTPAATATPTPAPNGYDTLLEAGKLIQPVENASPSATQTVSPEDKTRGQREAVTRNAPTLALARQALALRITPPQDAISGVFGDNRLLRALARQFIQESEVRLADGDAPGALASRLDCLEMAVAISRGPLLSMLTGSAIESLARNDIAPIAAKLDVAASRSAAARLREIERRRPTFAEILRLEQQNNLFLALMAIPDEENRAKYGTDEGRKEAEVSQKWARELLALTPETLRINNARLFNPAIAAAGVPFRLARMVPLPDAADSLTASARPLLQSPDSRFRYEHNVLQNRLLADALELHAQKLESGAYPENFVASRDPFTDGQSLIYKRQGDSYLLYSIGPDNRDNRGRAARSERFEFDAESGQTRALKMRNVGANAKGDIVAPIL